MRLQKLFVFFESASQLGGWGLQQAANIVPANSASFGDQAAYLLVVCGKS